MRRFLFVAGALLLTASAAGAQGGAKQPLDIPKVEFPTDSLGRIIFSRESYGYPSAGRRDPFASLIATGDIRPLFEDLQVSGIIVDPAGRNSFALLKDVSTQELYRARVGSVFGRIRITYIRAGQVGIAIDEFGFTRQEVLTQNAPSTQRTP